MEALRDRHLSYFVDLSERVNIRPFCGHWPAVWKLLKFEIENLRAALDWALGDAGNPNVKDGLRLAASDIWAQGGLRLRAMPG